MTHIQPAALTAAIKQEAAHLGFAFCRVVPAAPAPHAEFLLAWLDQGRAGEMAYLERYVAQRGDPQRLAEAGATFRSLIVLAANYHQATPPLALRDDPSRGLIAAYAWSDDYHDLIRPLLHALDGFIRSQTSRTWHGKCLVDSGPVLERDWAFASGLGFTGKNCCTIHPQAGSWLFLAVMLVPELLAYDSITPVATRPAPPSAAVLAGLSASDDYGSWLVAAHPSPHHTPVLGTCGRCTRCLTACPTAAFVGPYHLDPQRCIAYWTIEARTPVPRDLRPAFANRIFGCDICQEVCPWNRRLPDRSPRLPGLAAHPDRMAPPLLQGFAPDDPYWLDPDAFRARFRRSPIMRAGRAGMLRNVCIALGNWADPAVLPALHQALTDPDPLPRGHAAWALGRILARWQHPAAATFLAIALGRETDDWVRAELAAALAPDSTAQQPRMNTAPSY